MCAIEWGYKVEVKKFLIYLGIFTLGLAVIALFVEIFTPIVFITCGLTGLFLSFNKIINPQILYRSIIFSFIGSIFLVALPIGDKLNWDNAISIFSFGIAILLILRSDHITFEMINKEEEFSKHKYWYVAKEMKRLAETGEFRDKGNLEEIGELLGVEPDEEK